MSISFIIALICTASFLSAVAVLAACVMAGRSEAEEMMLFGERRLSMVSMGANLQTSVEETHLGKMIDA
jgi:hypothetical protein